MSTNPFANFEQATRSRVQGNSTEWSPSDLATIVGANPPARVITHGPEPTVVHVNEGAFLQSLIERDLEVVKADFESARRLKEAGGNTRPQTAAKKIPDLGY